MLHEAIKYLARKICKQLQRIVELQAQLDAVEWQPIETLPKDGIPVLVYVPRYKTSYTTWASGGEVCGIHNFDMSGEPTHWKPLPDPPAFQQEQSGE